MNYKDMSKEEIRTIVKKDLDTEWDGSANNYYSIISVFNTTKEEIESAIVELYQKDIMPYGCLRVDKDENPFSIVVHKGLPDIAQSISKLLPDKLCVGDMSWDWSCVELYKNGNKAKKNEDYLLHLSYESFDDDEAYDDEEEEYYDTEYVITDVSSGNYLSSGAGMILKSEMEAILDLSTSHQDYISRDDLKRE